MTFVRRQGARFLGKGPNGRNLCFCGCGREVKPPKQNWFEAKCYQEWNLKNDPSSIRRAVYERDHGICVLCGCDTDQFKKRISCAFVKAGCRSVYDLVTLHFGSEREEIKRKENWKIKRLRAILKQNGWPLPYEQFWHNDHIVPVVEGGGQTGLENYRCLCVPCHKKETKKLAARRATKRREEKVKKSKNPLDIPANSATLS